MTGPRGYHSPNDLPSVIPVFPLGGVLLLPRGDLPLNIFEPRYLEMIDDALAGDRVIGMIQPRFDAADQSPPPLCETGAAGRVTAFQETQDGRYLITLTGISRFRVDEELPATTPYRQCRVTAKAFADDFRPNAGEDEVDRDKLLATFKAYLEANDLKADWQSVLRAPTEALVNGLSMMAPLGEREKQALLEAENLASRADMLIAMTEMSLMRSDDDNGTTLQ